MTNLLVHYYTELRRLDWSARQADFNDVPSSGQRRYCYDTLSSAYPHTDSRSSPFIPVNPPKLHQDARRRRYPRCPESDGARFCDQHSPHTARSQAFDI